MTAQTANSVGGTVVETGRVFGAGGTDGLILYALILATFLMFMALVIVVWTTSRERTKAHTECTDQAKEFAAAAKDMAEALRDMATAVVSSSSAESTHRQGVGSTMSRVEILLSKLDGSAK